MLRTGVGILAWYAVSYVPWEVWAASHSFYNISGAI